MVSDGFSMFGDPGAAWLTPQERAALAALRQRRERLDIPFNERQLARLTFVRWLYRTGRLSSDTAPGPWHIERSSDG